MNYKKIAFIIFCLIVAIIYFNNVMTSISLIILLVVFSFIYQIIFSEYPLSSFRILTYTMSIIIFLSTGSILMSKVPFCEQLKKCEICIIHTKDFNGTK